MTPRKTPRLKAVQAERKSLPKQFLTDAEIRRLLEARRDGVTRVELQRRFKLSERNLSTVIRNADLPEKKGQK